jgi:carbon storage regulator
VLILNRRQGEAIIIEGGIRIVVLSSDRRGARIGIEAPPTVNIQREELVSRVAEENRRANDRSTGTDWLTEIPLKKPAS